MNLKIHIGVLSVKSLYLVRREIVFNTVIESEINHIEHPIPANSRS